MDMHKKREMFKKKIEENTELDKSCTSVNITWDMYIYANYRLNSYKTMD